MFPKLWSSIKIMLEKKSSQSQSQSLRGNTFSESHVQISQAGESILQISHTLPAEVDEVQTAVDVVHILEEIESFMRTSVLGEADLKRYLNYLEAARVELSQEEPDKKLVAVNLDSFGEKIKKLDDTLNSTEKILNIIQPVLKKLTPWLGVAAIHLTL